MAFYSYKEPAGYETHQKNDDIQSVEYIPDDIDSLAESTSDVMHYRQAAANYIVKILFRSAT